MSSPQLLAWVGFSIFVVAMMALDLGVFHRQSREVSLRSALIWSAIWIGLALAFNVGIYFWHGHERALQFFTGYVIELSLSVDNLFVFLLLFGYFKVPAQYQHKALFWGIIGALIMRAIFIAAGVTLIAKFHWITYIFGAVLVVSGFKMAWHRNKEIHPEKNPVLRIFRRLMPVTSNYDGDRFFTNQGGQLFATPLFLVVLLLDTDFCWREDAASWAVALPNMALTFDYSQHSGGFVGCVISEAEPGDARAKHFRLAPLRSGESHPAGLALAAGRVRTRHYRRTDASPYSTACANRNRARASPPILWCR
jgi:TerC family integral membrane protein